VSDVTISAVIFYVIWQKTIPILKLK